MSQLLIGAPAPDVAFVDSQNNSLALSSLRGEPVLLNFVKTNCTWCRSEMVNLTSVYKRVEHVQIKILNVFVGQDFATAVQFAQEQNLEISLVTADAQEMQKAFDLQRVPTFVFLDAEGKIACVYEGVTEQLAGIIEQTILAIAGEHELPEYSLVGNGCGIND